MKKVIFGAVALSALMFSAHAQAQDKLTVFWVKGFYKAEDDALYEAIAKFEKKSGEVFELREEIARCVQMARGEAAPAASGRDGLWSAGLCLLAEESIRQKRPLPVGEMMGE